MSSVKMVRKRKPKTWNNDDLMDAFQTMKVNGMSIQKASRVYGIPYSTLRDKFTGRSSLFATQGPKPYLNKEEERKIVDWANKMANLGCPQSRVDIQFVVKKILENDGREHPFLNNTPGTRWWKSFLKRNPNLTYRQMQRSASTNLHEVHPVKVLDQRIEMWFIEFEARLQKEGPLTVLTDPLRFCDEERHSDIDAVLSRYMYPASSTSTPGPAQSTPSTSSTLPQESPVTGPHPPDVFQSPQINGTHSPCKGVSEVQGNSKGSSPPAITVDEFFLYVRLRKSGENWEQKKIDRTKMRENKHREKEEEMQQETYYELVNDADEADKDDEDGMDAAEPVGILSNEGECVTEVTVATSTPVLEQEWKKQDQGPEVTAATSTPVMEQGWKKQGRGKEVTVATSTLVMEQRRKKPGRGRPRKGLQQVSKAELQKNIKAQVIEIMNSVFNIDVEEMKKLQKERAKTAKQVKKSGIDKRRDQNQKGQSKENIEQENYESAVDESQKELIVEAKDKVRTESNIKTVTNDQEIYVCPACLKSSNDNEKWISCDHCVRWLHLSCTSMHLLRGIDLAGFDYRCKFC